MNKMHRISSLLSAAVLGLACSLPAQAAAYPDKPIHLIVPFAAGGSTDILARMAGQAISTALGQPVVVENRAGASGNIGMEAVARAAPDGYTLLFTTTNLTLNPEVLDKVPYDPVGSFSGVSMLAFAPMILITKPGYAGGSLQSLVKYGLAHPGQLNFSSSGAGGAPHLAGEMLKLRTGMKMTHVPYKGAAPAIADIVAGQVQMTFTTYVSASAMLKAHRVQALAVASSKRLPVLPDVPTMEQAGFPGYDASQWMSVAATPGIPAKDLDELNRILQDIIKTPAFQAALENAGMIARPGSRQALIEFVAKDNAKWQTLIRQAGIKLTR